MSTESIHSKSLTLSKQQETFLLHLTFINGEASAALKAGQEVYINDNWEVTHRSTGAQFPIGTVTVGGAAGEEVTVATCFQRTLKAHAKGGTINPGDFVKPNGTVNANGKPEYVAVTAPVFSNGTTTSVLGDYIMAIVISGGAVDTEIELGILRTPITGRGSLSV